MPERLMGVDCKSTGYAYAGSNPARPIHRRYGRIYGHLDRPCGSVVEHTLGKGEVMGSIPITGFRFNRTKISMKFSSHTDFYAVVSVGGTRQRFVVYARDSGKS
jgi:hypothetical protein